MAQDTHAAAEVRRIVEFQKEYRERNGKYAYTFSDLRLDSEIQLEPRGNASCGQGYCYQLSSHEATYELRAWPDGHRAG
jgi:hypothetical protein